MHTYIGMTGNVWKTKEKNTFQFCQMNVNYEKMQEEVDECVKYGIWFAKKSLLHTQELHEKIAIFYRYKMRKKISTIHPSVIIKMLRFE
jgi:hypothetical protein